MGRKIPMPQTPEIHDLDRGIDSSSQCSIPFKLELPFEVWEKSGADPSKRRRIGGVISTTKTDRQGEVVLQRGLDFTEFLSNGWFNDNHSKETTGIIGYPEMVKKVTHNGRPGHYVEGYLLENFEASDKIWDLANSLQKTNRRLGFSVEGAITRREDNGRTIAEAKVRNVAITSCPVNTDTGLEVLAKSLRAVESEGDLIRRAMMAGQAISNPGTSAGQGFALRTESVEKKPKKKRKTKLSKSEAISFLRSRYKGMSKGKAARILSYVAARAAG